MAVFQDGFAPVARDLQRGFDAARTGVRHEARPAVQGEKLQLHPEPTPPAAAGLEECFELSYGLDFGGITGKESAHLPWRFFQAW